MKHSVHIYEASLSEVESLVAAAKSGVPLRAEQSELLERIVRSYLTVTATLREKNASLGRLRRMIFGAKTEKTQDVVDDRQENKNPPRAAADPSRTGPKSKNRPPGHGRNAAADYRGARKVCVTHDKLRPGDICPECGKGKLYEYPEPGILLRVTGQAPIAATVFLLQKLRCNLCLEIFQARPPVQIEPGGAQVQSQIKKYDASSASMMALLKYGSGLPFYRLQRLQGNLGVPLPVATQWEIVWAAAKKLRPVYDELMRQAAQGQVLHNDDTTMRILAWMGKRRKDRPRAAEEEPDATGKRERTGIFTSGIVSVLRRGGRRIALFMTGGKHAGENLKEVLQRRALGRTAPIQMCDALSRNVPKDFKTILANCLAHGRRQFVDVVENFPRECEHVLKLLARVYTYEAVAKKRGMTARKRLRFHQEKSRPLVEKLHAWMERQIDEKKVEPNSGLGQAIEYMLKHWAKLTLFLRKIGAPLDNNICERALKKAILHRKNSLFFKTANGARVGDLYMSLIHTCELNGVDPFDYLTTLQRHAKEVRRRPDQWMPWNYPKARNAARAG